MSKLRTIAAAIGMGVVTRWGFTGFWPRYPQSRAEAS